MKNLPAKQIYLLIVIIVGIIALSMYSTYAIFTYQSETSDVVSIELPSALSISTDMYEYKQLQVEPKSTSMADIDVYNTFEYDLCYSIWYKIIGKNSNLLEIAELNNEDLTTSGTLLAGEAKRVTLLIINNSNSKVKINIGVATDQKNDICNLKISSDKKTIRTNIDKNINYLSESIIKNISDKKTDSKDGYLIYKNISKELKHDNSIEVAISFTQENEVYRLVDSELLEINENLKNITNNYFCFNEECSVLSKINTYEVNNKSINITDYDLLVPYQKGNSGIKKIDNNYYFYGDNPNNFVKTNCDDEKCELWRIIGSFYNSKTQKYLIKLIKNETIGINSFNDNSNLWNEQNTLYKYLQKDFKINKDLESLSDNYPLVQELINTENNITKNSLNIKGNISLMNITDFLNTSTCANKTITESDCISGNWLNNTLINSEWTMTKYEPVNEELTNPTEENDELTEEIENQEEVEEIVQKEQKVISVGTRIEKKDIETKLYVRPTIYISDRTIIIDGDGSFDNPYVLK